MTDLKVAIMATEKQYKQAKNIYIISLGGVELFHYTNKAKAQKMFRGIPVANKEIRTV